MFGPFADLERPRALRSVPNPGRRKDPNRLFAYRERPRAPGDPVRPVEVVREGPPRSHKARVRRLDGEYEGLEEWVPKARLVAPWDEAERLLEDERRMLAVLEASGGALGTVPHGAAELVFLRCPRRPARRSPSATGPSTGNSWLSTIWGPQQRGAASTSARCSPSL
jgi:hypothetical protein